MGFLEDVSSFFLRYGEAHLMTAVVSSALAWYFMEAFLGTVDEHFTDFTSVRLTVRRSLTPTYVLWLVLRRGIPLLAGLFVFFLFFR